MSDVTFKFKLEYPIDDELVNNDIDRMQARLFYLITQFSGHPCRNIAEHIIQLLINLCRHPHIELLPAQHYIYSQSLNYWRSRLVHGGMREEEVKLH